MGVAVHRFALSCTLKHLNLRALLHPEGMAETAVRTAEQKIHCRCWKERTLLDQQNLGE